MVPVKLMQTRKLGGIASLILLLSACASGSSGSGNTVWTSPLPPLMTPTEAEKSGPAPRRSPSSPRPSRADQARLSQRRAQLAADAEALLKAAELEEDAQAQQLLLLQAAENARLAGRDHLAAEALDRLEELEPLTLDAQAQLRLTLVRAEMGVYADRPLTLLSALPRPGPELAVEDPARTARIWRLRSEAYLALGRILPATQALVNRETALRSPQAIEANRELIWRTLRSMPPAAMNARELARTDPITRGWIDLAQIMLDLWLSPSELTTSVNQWERRYADHPARSTVLASHAPATIQPRRRTRVVGDGRFDKIALLLPLTGPYETPARAVRDGFMVNYYARSQPRPDVLVYDTAGNPANLPSIRAQAMAAGADILVGPLTKEAVEELARTPDLGIPVLTLNYLEDGVSAPASLYQFGLSPEDEARQAAARAVGDGHSRALALVPRNDWGLRTLTAFNDELYKLGGGLVEYVYYNPADRDFSAPITQLLRYNRQMAAAIDAAQKRRRKAAPPDPEDVSIDNPETPLSAIRQDFDFIFLASKPQQARLIRPQLRFYRASAVPVYATSHVFSGTVAPQQDLDLDGIQFGDAPWTLAPAGAMAEARDKVARLWPTDHSRFPRLYAMGYDAYALATQLAQGNLRSDFGFPGATGLLTLEADGRINRGLQWARFGGGQPRLLSDSVMQPLGADAAFQ